MKSSLTIRGVIFDAYGTLFDVFAVESKAEEMFPGFGNSIATIWREKQIEYTRLRTLCDHYDTFWQITKDALDYTLSSVIGSVQVEARARLLDIYKQLPAHADACEVTFGLTNAGYELAILTNADPMMLAAASDAADLTRSFSHMLSVDKVRRFKTAPEAYQMGPDAYGCGPQDLLFVSSNGWDIAGASWYGYRTFWVNRSNAPAERLGCPPDGVGSTLHDLANFLAIERPSRVAAV